MLKIWKQAWKKEDSTRRPHSEQNSDAQGAPLSGASSGSFPLTSAAAAPLSADDVSLGPVLPRGRRGATKRTRAGDVTELSVNSDGDRPRKRTRFQDDETSLTKDTLGNHLPEVIEADAGVRPETPPLRRATFEEELFEQAKAENSEFSKYDLWRIIIREYLNHSCCCVYICTRYTEDSC
jgi:endoribonuclease Dicer